jgi:shikimate dehydrogenase
VADLRRNLGLNWSDPRILLLGAGGAARGVIGPLLELNPRMLVIANRTVARADQLVREFAALGPVSGCAFGELKDEHFDLIVNATSASLRGEVPAIPASVVDSLTTCYDMAYGTHETPFTNWGRVHGAERSVQGWGMLVEQAAEAFGLWRGVRPDTAPVLDALRSRMQPAH